MSAYLNQVGRKTGKVSVKYGDLLPERIKPEVGDFISIKGTALPRPAGAGSPPKINPAGDRPPLSCVTVLPWKANPLKPNQGAAGTQTERGVLGGGGRRPWRVTGSGRAGCGQAALGDRRAPLCSTENQYIENKDCSLSLAGACVQSARVFRGAERD